VRVSDRWSGHTEGGSIASYHFHAQIIQRSKGRSAVAAAAYRAGEKLRDERQGADHDFSRRRGVEWSAVLLPVGAPAWLRDRETLWNYVEQIEKREDAQLAREINLALPRELTFDQRRETLLAFVQEAFVSRGMVADVAIHSPVLEKGDHPDNHHAHMMLTLRRTTQEGLHRVKTREWNSDSLLTQWHEMWAGYQNRALERAGHAARVDHRSLRSQRDEALQQGNRAKAVILNRQPQVHIGPKAAKLARRGWVTRSVDRLRGPKRVRATSSPPSRRAVRYRAIDKGTRAAYCAWLAKRQQVRIAAEVKRWQTRSARMRLRKVRFERMLSLARVNFRWLLAQQDQWKWLERRESPHTLARQVEQAARDLAYAKRRSRQLVVLLAEVDRTLAGLLLSQGRVSGRAPLPPLSNNLRRKPSLRPGRSRARSLHPTHIGPRSNLDG